MPDRPRRLKGTLTGIFRRQPSHGTVPSPAATDLLQAPTNVAPVFPELAATATDSTFTVSPGVTSISSRAATLAENHNPAGLANTSRAKDAAVDNMTLLLDVTEKLAGFAQTIPFIAPAAGFLSQVLKVYKMQMTKRTTLLGLLTAISQDLCATVLRMEATNHVDILGRLKPDIETYTRLLKEAFQLWPSMMNWEEFIVVRRANQLGSRFTDLQPPPKLMVEKRLEEWLKSPPDMRQKQHETQKLRKEGTGRWFLEGNTFIEWQDNAGLLWIQGASGTGKSVLSSSVIQKLIDDQQLFADFQKSSAVAFFYFDFKAKDRNVVETALRRIILQLSAQSPHLYRVLDDHYNLSRGQALPSYQDLQRIVQLLLRELGRTYIILDALDECPDTELGELITVHYESAQPRTGLTEEFQDVPCVFLKSEVIRLDIELFIASELRENRRMKTWASRADEIVHWVGYKSSGMFRLAACLLLELSRCRRQNELEETLENLPNDLFGIYDRFLESIRPQDLVYATGVLRWLLFSTRSLNLTELADAVAFDFSNQTRYTYDRSLRMDNVTAIPEWLGGLITFRDYDDTFRYDFGQGKSHGFLAQSCIGYLLHFTDHPLDTQTVDNHPLAKYAAKRWCHHLLRSNDQLGMTSDAMLLLDDRSNQYTALSHLRNLYYVSTSQPGSYPEISPLLLCSEEGYIEGVRRLLEKDVDVNSQDRALEAASHQGHTEVVRLLLGSGADAKAVEGGKALQSACTNGHAEIVRLLLASGADANSPGTSLGTPLQAASSHGNTDITRILLEAGADRNLEGGNYGSALAAAAMNGHIDPVRLLLANGADVNINAQDKLYGTRVQAGSGDQCPARILGRRIAGRINERTHGHYAFTLDNGAYVDIPGVVGDSALRVAAENGHIEAVRLLLENGADVNPQTEGWQMGSALLAASRHGHMKIVQLLLDNGAGARAELNMALGTAAGGGNIEIVRLLLENGADVHADNGHSMNAAAGGGHMHQENRVILDSAA
ncbi:ankyrin repeat-containing domain protein [Mycena rebaudengoi]|nr:ankyrin repeat-containing domain protein [Mycena rebaudengoi]